jgi:hypothetical protein
VQSVIGICYITFGIALGYWLDERGSRVRFPAGAVNLPLHHRVHNGSGAHSASSPVGKRALSLGIKVSGREADYSPQSGAEVTECVDLYLQSPYTPSWCGAWLSTGTNLPLPTHL